MNFVDDPMLIIAVLDLGVAIECLRSLLKIPRRERGVGWAHEVCTYSRYIHINIWSDRPSINYVKNEILDKLLKNATSQTEVLGKLDRFNEVERNEIMHFNQNDKLRVKNLEENFLNGLPSDFDPAEEEPANQTIQPD